MAEFGDPRLPRRFWDYVTVSETGCWIWTGSFSTSGYGQWNIDKRRYQAHRAAYEALVAAVPRHLVCDHLCYVKECVNPEHIEPVTQRENVIRAMKWHEKQRPGYLIRSHCKHGHELTPENSFWNKKRGRRSCRKCMNAAVARYAKRKRQAMSLYGETTSSESSS